MKWTERIRKKTDFKKQIEKKEEKSKEWAIEKKKTLKNTLKQSETSSILWLSCHQQHLLLSRNQLVDTWKQNYNYFYTCQSTWSQFTYIQSKCKSKFFFGLLRDSIHLAFQKWLDLNCHIIILRKWTFSYYFFLTISSFKKINELLLITFK